MKRIRGHGWTILAALAVLGIYAASLSILPRHVFWMPDEGAKYMELHSVHWAGDIRYEVPFPARRIDPGFEFLPHPELFPRPSIASDGSLYLAFQTPVLFPLVSRVPLRLFGLTGIYVLPLVSGWCIAILSGALMSRIHPRWAPFAVLLVGVATPVWFYSLVFWEHTVACVFALLAVAIVTASPRWRPAAVLAVTAALTAAATLRFEMLAFAVAVFLGWGVSSLAARRQPSVPALTPPAAHWPLRRWVLHFLLVAFAAGLLVVFDAALTLRHRKLLVSVPVRIEAALTGLWSAPGSLVEVFIHSPISEGPAISDAIAITAGIAVLLCFVAAFVKSARAEAVFVLPGCAALLAFSLFLLCTAQSYRSLHGLFPVAPFLILWPYALRHAWRERSHILLALTNVSLFHFATGLVAISMSYISGGKLEVGMEWGQRYLLILYPVLAIATLVSLRTYQRSERPQWLRRAFTAAVAAMMIVGVGLEIRGLTMLYNTRQGLSKWERALRAEGPIVTDVWWLPSAVAVLFTEHEMFFVSGRADTARWVELAAVHGVSHFTFASLKPVAAREFGTRGVRRIAERAVDGLHLTSFILVEGRAEHTPG